MSEDSFVRPSDDQEDRPTKSGGNRSRRTPRAKARADGVSEIDLLNDISLKLDRVVAVLASQGKARDTQISILGAAGCDSTLVAAVVGMHPGAVRKHPAWRGSEDNSREKEVKGKGTTDIA